MTAALNAHHIVKRSGSSSSGCGGGYQITVVIVPQHSAPVRLAAYRCAGRTSGDIGGDVAGFLSSLGIAS